MKAQWFCLLALLVLPFLASAVDVSGKRVIVGGWQPIKNVNDPSVTEIGAFAVAEYDKTSNADLKFIAVVKGETQVVAGIKYRLIVEAKDRSVVKRYEAVVWEKAWENFRKLTSFKPVEP